VNLRRPLEQRVVLLCFGALFVGGAVITLSKAIASVDSGIVSRVVAGLVGLAAGAIGVWMAFEMLRPFRFHIGPDGLDIRHRGLRRTVRWHELDAVVLDDGPDRGRGTPPARLLLLPVEGVELGRRPDGTVEGRPALVVLSLDDVAADPEDVVEALTRYAAGRFRNNSKRVAVDLDGVPLHRLNEGEEGRRTLRWLRLRGLTYFTGWFLLILLPTLLGVRLVADRNDGLGPLALLVASVVTWVVAGRLLSAQSSCRSRLAETARIRGTSLVTGLDASEQGHELHAGRARVLPPGPWWRRGRAASLAFAAKKGTTVVLLLSDPRTGRPRPRGDLDALAGVLSASPHPQDHEAGLAVAELAASATIASPASPRRPRAEEVTLLGAVGGVGRLALWAAVVIAYGVAAGVTWPYDPASTSGATRALLLLGCFVLAGTWVLYALFQTVQLLRALGRAVTGGTARRL
jgi:hypothetical protein